MADLSTYKKFFSVKEAAPILEALKENNILFEFIKSKHPVDPVIAGKLSDTMYELKIAPDRFEDVTHLLESRMQIDLKDIDKDHYLFSFTDQELKEIMRKPDEWGYQDYGIARLLLKERGVHYTEEEYEKFKQQRNEQLAKPEKLRIDWLILAFVFMFLGGLIGIFMGLAIWQSKKTLPNGSKVYTYDLKTRKLGLYIMTVSTIIFVLSLFTNMVYSLADWISLFWTWY